MLFGRCLQLTPKSFTNTLNIHTHTHTLRVKATRGKLLQSEFLCRRHSEKYATEMRNDSRQQVESKSRGREEEVEEGGE